MKNRRSADRQMAEWREAPVLGVEGIRGSSLGQTGTAAPNGIEAAEVSRGVAAAAGRVSAESEASGSGSSVKLNIGGWSVARDFGNHMLLYIWMLKVERRG